MIQREEVRLKGVKQAFGGNTHGFTTEVQIFAIGTMYATT